MVSGIAGIPFRRWTLAAALLALPVTGRPNVFGGERATTLPPMIRANDNRVAAGRASPGAVDLVLTARLGRWYPDGDRRPAALLVPAFAEGDGAPSVPGPMIRVRAGTRVHVTVRNALDGALGQAPLIVHGLAGRPAAGREAARVAPLVVPPGATREVTFRAETPGTYYYWAAVSDSATIANREGIDAALGGAIVVDPAEGSLRPDRVFVIDRMVLPPEGKGDSAQPQRFAVTVNGLSWPHTERLDAAVGDTVRWRWINSTNEHHPMHLHGFYYHVDALGDEGADTAYARGERPLVVTQRMDEGGTMAMTWVPERAGNWLVHCHLRAHSGPDATWGFPDVEGTGAFGRSVVKWRDRSTSPGSGADGGTRATRGAASHDMMRDMAGLVLGIRVRATHGEQAEGTTAPRDRVIGPPRHEVRLTVLPPRAVPPGQLAQVDARVDDARLPGALASVRSEGIGPPIVLRRAEPARITVMNEMREPTAVHWHGIELESYYDGVPGWTGGVGGGRARGRLSPVVAPGGSFAALMTPPRAGTLIYHSHALSTTQVGDGLYGALIVLDAGDVYDPADEVIWIVGGRERNESDRAFLLLNGARSPAPLSLVAGRRYHVRLISISESNTADVALLDGEAPDANVVEWRPLSKDAVPLLGTRGRARPARLRTSVGETFDFELTPLRAGVMRLEVRNAGDLMVAQRVLVR